MTATSRILIITLGSFTQLPEGTNEYNEQDAILSRLPDESGSLLMDCRGRAFGWLKREKRAKWQGVAVPDLKYNKALVRGRDFGGSDERALHFPALRRFQGRFYQALGLEGKRNLYLSHHHVLFLCGLYGLMAPMEPIQAYNCPIEGRWRNYEIWTEDNALTNVLLSYMQDHGITRVFDLTAMSVRRKLINWAKVRNAAPNGVVHCVGKTAAGEDLLIPFGHLMRDFLLTASEDKLSSIGFGTEHPTATQDICFHEKPSAHSGGPREAESDELVEVLERRQLGIIRFLDKAEGGYGKKDEITGKRISRLLQEGKISRDEKKAMRLILDWRNEVRYRERKPRREELKQIDDAWEYLSGQVEKHGWQMPVFQNL